MFIQLLDEIFLTQIDKTIDSAKNEDIWKPGISKFYKVKQLSIDERGRNGQEFLQTVFKIAGYKTQGDNEKTGDWDIKINNKRVEVKTACMDRTKKFQHENVHRTNNYDFLFFLDIAPEDIYFAVVKYCDIPWDALHERGNDSDKSKRVTGAGYKYDLKYDTKNLNDKKLPKHWGKVATVDDIVKIYEDCLKS